MAEQQFRAPKDSLLGMTIGSGWNVVSAISKSELGTGGTFSTGYVVEKEGRKAFLKAMDLTSALLSPPETQIRHLNFYTQMIQFEGLVLKLCQERKMSRVVRLIEDGVLTSNEGDVVRQAISRVHFFIFELGDADVRNTFGAPRYSDIAARLKVLHDTALAIDQLHRAGIAHQDVKPSNVLAFSGGEYKVADLGRASLMGSQGPTDSFPCAGDWGYAPPELVYGYLAPEYTDRRFGTDAYLLGSMIAFMFTLQSATTLLQQAVPCQFLAAQWAQVGTAAPWNGTFTEVLPHLVQAHARVCEYVEGQLPGFCRVELGKAFFDLTHPDPTKRGHPKARREVGRLHGMDRYASLFDLLGKAASIEERKIGVQK